MSFGVLLDRLRILRFLDVIEDVAELHVPEAFEMGTVRIAFFLGKRVVLTVNGHPLLRDHSGRNPERKPERPRDGWMQYHRAMRGCTMQINRGAEDGRLQDQHRNNQTPHKRREHSRLLVRELGHLPAGRTVPKQNT